MISEAKAFRVLVVEYLSPTVDTKLLFSCKFVRVITRHFVIRVPLEYNDRMITKCQVKTEIIVLNVQLRYHDAQ